MNKKVENILREYKRGKRDFINLKLDGFNFDKQDLSGSDFSGSSLLSTSFKSAKLENCIFSGVKAGLLPQMRLGFYIIILLLHAVLGILISSLGFASTYFWLPDSFDFVVAAIATTIVTLFIIIPSIITIFYRLSNSVTIGFGALIAIGSLILKLPCALGLSEKERFILLTISAIFPVSLSFYLEKNVFSLVQIPVLIWIILALYSLIVSLFYWLIFQGLSQNEWLELQTNDFISGFGTNFKEANLLNAKFIEANLRFTNLVGSKIEGSLWINAKGLDSAAVSGNFLANLRVQKLLVRNGADRGQKYVGCNLTGINLENAKLEKVDFTQAVLDRANLSGADLSHGYLVQTQLNGADLTGADLTGVCISDWGINRETKMVGVTCDYVYLREDCQERRPSSGTFKPGEFAALSQKVMETVDLIFVDGIDWTAFLLAFQELRKTYNNGFISIQAIEKKADEAFVIRLEVPAEASKMAIEAAAKEMYEDKKILLEEYYRSKLNAKDSEILAYRERYADLYSIVEKISSAPKYNFQGAQFAGGFAENVYGYQIGGAINNYDAIREGISNEDDVQEVERHRLDSDDASGVS